MENNENKKGSEALPDDALDKVAGGRYTSWEVFKENNCDVCCHFYDGCPYGAPTGGFLKLGNTSCPDKA